jgi:amino acid adenylation domain-containing protein
MSQLLSTQGQLQTPPKTNDSRLNRLEQVVVAVWEEVLELDDIGPDDDFFDLGGDSLSAIQILSRLGKLFDVKLSEAEFFTARTVKGLCQFIRQAQKRTSESGAFLRAQPGPRQVFPTTSSQQRLWVLNQLIPNPEVYNIPFLLQIQGDLDIEALRTAFAVVEARHEVLRSHYESANGVPIQVIAPPSRFALPFVDLRHLPHADRMAQITFEAAAQASRPMDLTAPRLWEAKLFQTGSDEYYLWTNLHHNLTDGWSYGVLFKDLEAAYEAARKGVKATLPELAIQYGDYAVWQREWLKTASYREQVEHWKKVLAAPVATLELPFSKPRPRTQTFKGAIHTFQVPRKLTNAVDRFCRQESVTRFMVGLAAFNVLLHRYTGQEDLLVGTPVAGRNQPELEPLVGLFVNTLILRTNVGGDPTFKDLIDRVRKVRLDAFTHQDIPLEALIEELQPVRDTSRQPFFQFVFQYQNVKIIPDRLSRHKVTVHPIHNNTSMFDLRLVLEDGPYDSLWAWIEYNTDLFDKFHVEQLAQHFLTVLEAAVASPKEKISRLPLLPAETKKRIIADFNATSGDYPSDRCFHEYFEEQVRRTPDAVAVVADGKEYSYAHINQHANKLARYLRQRGVKPGVFVGVCLRRSQETITAVLAVLKAGGAYVPLDSSYPKDRLAFMLRDTGAPIVLTQSALLARLPEDESRYYSRPVAPQPEVAPHRDPVVPVAEQPVYCCLDHLETELAQQVTENPDRINGPDDLAYVIYTSGSTGLPKGVMLRHRPVCNILDWVNQTFQVKPSDRVLFVTSLSFDLSVYDIFGVLAAGGSIRVATEDELRDPTRLLEILRTEPITIWDSAPAALQQLAPFFGPGSKADSDASNLKLVMLSGDWIPVGLPDQVRGAFPSAQVVSLGGATEAAIWSNWYPIEKVDPKWPSIPYGKPIRNARYHILDKHLQPVPIGVPGELHIGGDVLADGYLNRIELTAERFIADPFDSGEAKLYKTGDLARYFPDGNIEFLGRIDSQVKVRGFRVEAGEIEAVLTQHAAILEAVVRPHKDSGNQLYLVAYVVLRPGYAGDTADFARHLQAKLPEYMVPSQFVTLERMPLTPNGKVDRAALLPPKLEQHGERGNYQQPVDAVEQVIASIWSEILGVEKVGRLDNFFELGGHSLRGAQLIARIQERFSVSLRLPIVFEKPTVADMTEAVRNAGVGPVAMLALKRSPNLGNRAPLSHIQQRFWFIDQTIADRSIYNVNDCFRIEGPVDVAAFQSAWKAAVDRQEALRTVIAEAEDGQVIQVVLPSAPGSVEYLDFQDSPGDVDCSVAHEARRPFDLKTEPLWRAYLYHIGKEDYLFHWNIHHMWLDESSRVVLLRDLWTAYGQALKQDTPGLPPLTIRYRDFAVWQRDHLDETRMAGHLAYWKERLDGAAPPVLPPHLKARPKQRTFCGGLVRFEMPAGLGAKMAALARQAGVTPFVAYLAAYETLLFRYTHQTDICVGTPISNRPTGLISDLVGCFTNTAVIRNEVSGAMTFRQLVSQVHAAEIGMMEHSEVPFERIVEEVRPERVPGGHPIFQTVFVYENEELRGVAPGGLRWRMDRTEHIGAKMDFTLVIEDRPGRLQAAVEYSSDLYDPETIQRISRHFVTLLEAITANPDSALAQLPILPKDERKLVVEEWNETRGDFPADRCVHQFIEQRAALTPDSIAFEFEGKSLTYAQWNEQANQLANYLRANGVGPSVPVALCLERSLDLAAAILGVVKAGGCYAPFDPSHPADRLAYTIADTKAPIILTHRSVVGRLPANGARIVCAEDWSSELRQYSSENPPSLTSPDDPFVVIYTSGSTGRPKGVALPHRGMVNLIHSKWETPRIAANDVCLALTTCSFDAHLLDFWFAPAVGARVVIVPREQAMDGLAIAQKIYQVGATVMTATPATWRLLLEANWRGNPNLRAYSGGEAISPDMAKQMLARVKGFWNEYGPAECTVFATQHRITDPAKSPPVGQPISNTRIYLLDPSMQPVPVGCTGEIYIGGAGVGLGYLNQPELTREKFLPDPFVEANPASPARMYRTGDLGRYLPDGTLECLGRADNQVKIRGYRIELGEIETVFEKHPNIRQAVVVVRKNQADLDTLHSYFTVKSSPSPSAHDLRHFLLGSLPDYMVPSTFTRMDALPLSPNGKVDRKTLPDPNPESAGRSQRKYVEPTNDAERALQPIWEEVFGIEQVGVTDDFNELGGHSLLAAVLMSKIETKLGHRVPLEALFDTPTIRGLANRIQAKLELGAGGVLVPLHTSGDYPPLFMIAGAGGHVFAFHKFARLLGPQFNVYGMKAIGVDGTEPPLESISEIAKRYVAEITKANPDGPYVVSGYSVGGIVAFELALQLQQAGKKVSRVLIFDTLAPGYPRPQPLHRRLYGHGRHLLRLPWRKKWIYLKERFSHVRERVLRTFGMHHVTAERISGMEIVPQERLKRVWGGLLKAHENYWPDRKFDGQVVVIGSSLPVEWVGHTFDDPTKGWSAWATEPVKVYEVPAPHREVFRDEYLDMLIGQVREVLRSAKMEQKQ